MHLFSQDRVFLTNYHGSILIPESDASPYQKYNHDPRLFTDLHHQDTWTGHNSPGD